ncbi:MAG: hypothetical protein AAF674_03895 [Pseudomonadota bacterium]
MRAILIGALMLAACTTRFDADFEQDVLGGLPAAQPPGPPADEIVVSTSTTSGDGTLIRITDNPEIVAPGADFRFMSLIRDPDPGATSIALLRSSPMETATEPLFVTWTQVLNGGGTGRVGISRFPLGDIEDFTQCQVTTTVGGIVGSCFIGETGPDVSGSIQGFDPQRPHLVSMRINRPGGPIQITVTQENVSFMPIELADPDMSWPDSGARLQAQIEYDGQGESAYRFNQFLMTERLPD